MHLSNRNRCKVVAAGLTRNSTSKPIAVHPPTSATHSSLDALVANIWNQNANIVSALAPRFAYVISIVSIVII